MNATELRELLTAGYVADGFPLEGARRHAEFVEELSRMRAKAIAVNFFSALRGTIHGEAVYRALVADDPETLEAAARRLHVNPSVIRRHRQTIRDLIELDRFKRELIERWELKERELTERCPGPV